MKIKTLTILIGLSTSYTLAQPIGLPPNTGYPNTPSQAVTNANFACYRGGNNSGGPAGGNNIFGTRWNSDIWIMTNNTIKARFTHNNDLSSWAGNFGDGLRIIAPAGTSGHLDLFTSNTAGAD